jgi:capsular exopolysaccharide synthesis family protein
MNRIQQILSKAERDRTVRQGSDVGDLMSVAPAPPPATAPAPDPRLAATGRAIEPNDNRPLPPPGIVDDRAATPPLVTPRQAGNGRLQPVLVAAHQPFSPVAELYRSLRTKIGHAENGTPLRVIQITSPGKNDGKTVTAVNLALTMAQEFQRRVLMVDADLRRPTAHALCGVSPEPGLVDVLTGTATLEEALIELPDHHLTILPAGRPYGRPTEMLASGPMRRLIDTLRMQFDRIVIDSAPAHLSDAAVIEPLADTVLIVVRAGLTTKPAIERAIGALGSSKLLGLVLNDSGLAERSPYGATA